MRLGLLPTTYGYGLAVMALASLPLGAVFWWGFDLPYPPIIAIAPAIANAVFEATGVRVRSMPIRLKA